MKKLALTLCLLTTSAHAQMCYDAWDNGFQPSVRQTANDCTTDKHKPLFTREGAIVCQTQDGVKAASEAYAYSWHPYSPLDAWLYAASRWAARCR